MRNQLSGWTATVALVFLMLAIGGCGEPEQRYNVASGGIQGVYYQAAVGLSQQARAKGLTLEPQSTGGSVENARLIGAGDADFAIMQNDIAAYAMGGDAPMFTEPIENIRGVAALYPEHIQVVARADAGIDSIADLRGKRVGIGARGSGTEANALQVLAAYGLSEEDLGRVERLGAGDAADYLQDDRLDAAFYTFGVGTGAIRNLAANADIRLIPIEGQPREQLLQTYGFYREGVIPAGSYEGEVEADVPTVTVIATLVAREDVPAEVVRTVLASMLDNLETFSASAAALQAVNREDAEANLTLPMHEGAKAFYSSRQ